MKKQNEQRIEETHWVGMDVSKRTFDAALAGPEQRFPSTPLRALPWKAFPRTREGVIEFLAWLDEQTPMEMVRVIMECRCLTSESFARWRIRLLNSYPTHCTMGSAPPTTWQSIPKVAMHTPSAQAPVDNAPVAAA